MQRRTLLQGLATLLAAPLLPACARESAVNSSASTASGASAAPAAVAATAASSSKAAGKAITPLDKPATEWKPLL